MYILRTSMSIIFSTIVHACKHVRLPFFLQLVVMLQIDAIFRGVDWSIPGVSNSFSIGVRGFQIANVGVVGS